MHADKEELLDKVKFMITHTQYSAMLTGIIDSIYQQVEEEYDTEPLSPECLQALDEVEAAVKRGDMSRFISMEEFERKHGL